MTDIWTESNIQDIDYQINAIRRNQEMRPVRPLGPEDYARCAERADAWAAKSPAENLRPYLIGLLWMVAFIFLTVPLFEAVFTLFFYGVPTFLHATLMTWLDMVTFNFPSYGTVWILIVVPFWLFGSSLSILQDSGWIV